MENIRERSVRYLTIPEIMEVADRHVGNYHILNEERLHYLIDAVSGKFAGVEIFPSTFQKAAVYAHHIIKGHIFLDGNKRIGMNCAMLFLELNGYLLHFNIDDSIIELGLKIADGSITDIDTIAEHIQQWIVT